MVETVSESSGPACRAAPDHDGAGRAGFTMVEVIVAILVLAIGLLGMAGTTAVVVRQVTAADLATERSMALETTLERLQSLPFDSLTDGSDSVGIYEVRWRVSNPTGFWAQVEITTIGPGLKTGGSGFPSLQSSVADTFTHRILR